MRYTVEVVIDAPRTRVAELFVDSSRFGEWMNGLERYEVVEGAAGEAGARAELRTSEGKRVFEMTEVVERNDLPQEHVTVHETTGVWNRVTNRFAVAGYHTTRWTSENEFRFNGMRKLLVLMVWVFKSKTRRDMEAFRIFAERETGGGA